VTSEELGLLIAYLVGRLSYEEYVARSGVDHLWHAESFERELRAASVEQDGDTLDWLLVLGVKRDLVDTRLAPLLASLLLEEWHTRHDELARILQDLRDPAVADTLAAAATTIPPYLAAVDSGHAFARKCIWALADIGTVEAHQHLLRLARHPDREVAGYAARRLDRWEDRLGREPRRPGDDGV
jgi:hypothetical protein